MTSDEPRRYKAGSKTTFPPFVSGRQVGKVSSKQYKLTVEISDGQMKLSEALKLVLKNGSLLEAFQHSPLW